MMLEEFKENLDTIATEALACEEYVPFTDMELVDATTIFEKVIMAKMWEGRRVDVPVREITRYVEKAGKELHRYVLEVTGKDLKEMVRKETHDREQ